MSFLGRLLGYLSVVVNLLLSLALLGVGLIAAFETSDLNLGPLPAWAGTVTRSALYGDLCWGLSPWCWLAAPAGPHACHTSSGAYLPAYIGAGAFISPAYRFDGVEDFQAQPWDLRRLSARRARQPAARQGRGTFSTRLPHQLGLQLGDDFPRCLSRSVEFARAVADRPNPCVSAAAVALAQRRQIVLRVLRPGA